MRSREAFMCRRALAVCVSIRVYLLPNYIVEGKYFHELLRKNSGNSRVILFHKIIGTLNHSP